LFHADGRTDKTKLIVAFHNFVNAPKKGFFSRLKKHTHIHTHTPEEKSNSFRCVVCVCVWVLLR
jgi:hypothetical protein